MRPEPTHCRTEPCATARSRSMPLVCRCQNSEVCRWIPLNSARRVRCRSFPIGNGPSGPRYILYIGARLAILAIGTSAALACSVRMRTYVRTIYGTYQSCARTCRCTCTCTCTYTEVFGTAQGVISAKH